MAESDNYLLPSKLRTEMLINEQNGVDLKYGIDYDFETPKPSHSSGIKYNTSLVLAFKGDRQGIKERVFYRRLSIDYVRKNKPVPIIKIGCDTVSVAQVLPVLNQHYGLGLDMTDLVNETFDLNSDIYYECKVAGTSLAWNDGVLPFTVDRNVFDLATALPVTCLNGLCPPTSLPLRP